MANKPRLQIDNALLAQLAATMWGMSPVMSFIVASKHFRLWSEVDASDQPAVFLRRILEDPQQNRAYGQTKYTFRYEAWIYLRMQNNVPEYDPYADLDPVIDAVDAQLAANPVTSRNTLGGLVDNCYISGQIVIADGMDDGQAVIRIPISAVTGV